MKGIIAAVMLILSVCLPQTVFGSNNRIVTRIEFIERIVAELKLEYDVDTIELADISKEDRRYALVITAMKNGLISGYGNGKIKPYEPIKREDALVILCRAYNIEEVSAQYLTGVADRNNISGYAKGAVAAVMHNGIIKHEYGEMLLPKDGVGTEFMEELITSFKRYGGKRLTFSVGYPRSAEHNAYGRITLELRTSLPCNVYYKMVPSDAYLAGYMPDKSEIDTFLTSIAMANTVVEASITPEENCEYNIYIMAVNEDKTSYIMSVVENVAPHQYTVGEGTKENPYRIYDETQLKAMKYHPKSYFSLQDDIELTSEWKPIEIKKDGMTGFSGELDGNYYKITNLIINGNNDNVGIFKEIQGGSVKCLYLDATVYGNQGVGMIAGRNNGNITECFVTGRVHAKGNNAGAIAGINEGKIENCVAAAYMVEAGGYAGGIAGSNRRGRIENCISAVYSVSSDMYASGVAGVNLGGIIKNTVCANSFADDILTLKSGRITTNKEDGICENNYCYDKMLSDSEVMFGIDTHDGLEVSWKELTSSKFYREALGWNTSKLWSGGLNNDFRLPAPKGFESIEMIKGITMYAPIKVSDRNGLLKVKNEPAMHYILTSDIRMGDTEWEMIAENGSEEEGFSGTFDGNNRTIYDLNIGIKTTGNYYGMFGVISSGTVRNLKLKNLAIDGASLVGGIAAENYGYIENCSVSGRIYALRKDNMLSVGGVCGNNYGFIEDVDSTVKIRADGQVLTIGGIVANNEGFVNNTEFAGSLKGEFSEEFSNAVAGGICGINIAGIIYNSYADPKITTKASTNYVGGVVGIADGGEVYKTSAGGRALIDTQSYYDATVYAGGVAGLAPKGLIVNSFSNMDITAESNAIYAGGVVGYNMNSSVQNTYTTSKIEITGKNYDSEAACYAGGICGYSESGFISDSVAFNRRITSNGIAAGVGNAADGLAVFTNNYSATETKKAGEETRFSKDGKKVSVWETDTMEFFFKPIIEEGTLGWSKGDIWTERGGYILPVLSGVKGQEKVKAELPS